MDIQFKAQLTADDYVEAQYLHGWKKAYLLYVCMITFVFCVLVFVLNPLEWYLWLIVLAAWVIALLAGLKTIPKTIAKRTRKIFAQQKSLQIPRDIRITDTVLYTTSERGDGNMPWDDFHKWKADEKIILVYPSDLIFHMFPRRWFPSDADYFGFQELLTRTIGPAGKARKRT